MNRGGVGARSLNIELQQALNPPASARSSASAGPSRPATRSCRSRTTTTRRSTTAISAMVAGVDPGGGRADRSASTAARSTYGFGELDTLVPAYAATIHKSQGSEYPAVVIPVMTQHYTMLQRNLLYTGVTRGKRLVVLVGQKKAVAIAVKNVS